MLCPYTTLQTPSFFGGALPSIWHQHGGKQEPHSLDCLLLHPVEPAPYSGVSSLGQGIAVWVDQGNISDWVV